MTLFRKSIIGGICLSSFHMIWALFVAMGWAQPIMDFVFKLHMLNSPFQVQPFNIALALGLIIFTFLMGCFYVASFFFIKNLLSK